MPFVVQNDSGNAPGANAYTTVQEFRDYHTARGLDTSTYADPAVQAAIIKATDYIDTRFRYIGRPYIREQATAWPRFGGRDAAGWGLNGVHQAVKRASHEYALRALTAPLLPDPPADPSGRRVVMESSGVGSLRETKQYAHSGVSLPDYPAADQVLRNAGLVMSGGRLVRA